MIVDRDRIDLQLDFVKVDRVDKIAIDRDDNGKYTNKKTHEGRILGIGIDLIF